jgi:mannosyltransferase
MNVIIHPRTSDETVVLARVEDEPLPPAEPPEPPDHAPPAGTRPGRHAAPSRIPSWVRRWLSRAGLFLPPAVLALALGLTGLGERRMWGDEYATWYAVTLPWDGLFQLLDHVDRVLTEYYLAMHVWVGLAGDSPTALRLPSVVAMACAAGLTALVGRRLAGAPVGLLAGLILATLPTITRYAQEARPYALAVAGAALTTLLLLRALDRPLWPRWIAYAIGMVLLAWLHLVAVLVLGAHLLLVWLAYRAADRDVRMWKFVGALAALFAAVMPLALVGSRQTAAIDWIRADLATVRHTPQRLFGTTLLAGAVIAVGLLAPLVADRPARRPALALATWAILPPLATYATFPLLHLFLHRYLLFTLPAWALLAAISLGAVTRFAATRPVRAASFVATAALALPALAWLALPGQQTVRRQVVTGEPDFHAAAALIAAGQHQGDGIAYAGTFRGPRTPIQYELRHSPRPDDVFLAPPSKVVGGYRLAECRDAAACLGKHTRLWLVTTTYSRDPLMEMPKERYVLLRQRFTVVADQRLTKVRVLLLVRHR